MQFRISVAQRFELFGKGLWRGGGAASGGLRSDGGRRRWRWANECGRGRRRGRAGGGTQLHLPGDIDLPQNEANDTEYNGNPRGSIHRFRWAF